MGDCNDPVAKPQCEDARPSTRTGVAGRTPTLAISESEASSVSERSVNPESSKRLTALYPFKSPSYPPRVHFHERAALQESLRSCEERLQGIRNKLETLGN